MGDLRPPGAGSSFYAGMRVLPKAEREAMFAVYGFCRVVDDIADDQQGDRTSRARALAQWRADVDALYAGQPCGQAQFLIESVSRFNLQKADFISVIDGMQMDVERDIRWPSFDEFDLYCDRVASAVGRLSVRIFGMDHGPGLDLSHHLGRALQFTNILRDIAEDAAIGRVYLPREALEAAQIAPSTPTALVRDPRLDTAAHWLGAKAPEHVGRAHAHLAARAQGRLPAPRLMEAAYSRLLAQMVAQGWNAPRQRVRVSKPRLLLSLIRFALLP